jgi:2-polyprenyl-3-methyl-5-hydroxy-6-metoxy-1,4-benzoquinol methylase
MSGPIASLITPQDLSGSRIWLASYDDRQSSRQQDREAQMATAVEAWEERWATPEGRADWLVPHPAVAALVPVLKARGTQHVLDLGCGVGRHALLFAENGFAVEAIEAPSPASTLLAARRPRAASD